MPLSDFLKRSLVAIAALVWLAPPLASAQVGGPIGGGPGGGFGGEVIPGVDWEARLQIDQRLRPLGNDLFGDRIDPHTGSVDFLHTDIVLPGNSALEVALHRRNRPGRQFGLSDAEFGDWEYVVPRILVVTADIHPWTGNRCALPFNNQFPPVWTSAGSFWDNRPATMLQGHEYSNGVQLEVGGRSEPLLQNPSNAPWPSGASHVTHSNWYFTCLGNNNFLGRAPDGTTYRFDRHIVRDAMPIPLHGAPRFVHRDTHILAATEVTDPHGNWVRYEYDSLGRLTRIHANDGRSIDLAYSGSSLRVASATANGRTWTYTYGVGGGFVDGAWIPDVYRGGNPVLTRVDLPDGRHWAFEMAAMQASTPPSQFCVLGGGLGLQGGGITLTHPSGAQGVFHIEALNHRIAFHEMMPQLPYCPEMDLEFPQTPGSWPVVNTAVTPVMSLLQKTITGTDLPTAVWTYEYEQDMTIATESDNRTNWTRVTGPESVVTFYHRWRNEPEGGAEIRREVRATAAGPVLERIDTSYIIEPNFGAAGPSGGPILLNSMRRQTAQVVRTRGSDVYTSEFTYVTDPLAWNYSFGNPVQTRIFSNLTGATERITQTTYQHLTNPWVLGLPTQVVRNGHEVYLIGYTAKGQPTTIDHFGARVETRSYNANGTLAWVRDGLNRQTSFGNYHRGQARTITRPDSVQILVTVDNNGWITGVTNARGFTTTYSYNQSGWLTAINRPLPRAATSISYNGLVQTITTGTVRETVTHDAYYRPVLVRQEALSGGGGSIFNRTVYDAEGRVVFASFPAATAGTPNGVETTHDALGRVTLVRESVAPFAQTATAYLSQNRVQVTDPSGAVTTTTRSGYASPDDGETLQIAQPLGVLTTMAYNTLGSLISATQSGGGLSFTQTWAYDTRERVCRHVTPETGATLYLYNAANEITALARGEAAGAACGALSTAARINYVYDNLGRVSAINYPAGTASTSLSYDANSNLTQASRGGAVWSYVYDNGDRLTRETLAIDGRSYQTDYAFNPNGAMISQTTPGGRTVSYQPDGLGRATRASDASRIYASNAAYHPSGGLTALSYGNGHAFTASYNARQLMSAMQVSGGGVIAVSFAYNHDARGRITSITDLAVAGQNRSFTYDGLGRLTTATGPWGSGSYTYDALNNLLTRTLGSRVVEMEYNASNRLHRHRDTGDGHVWRNYAYDSRGNVTHNGTIGFTYDRAERPVSISGGASGSFTYDAHGRRVKQVVGGQTIYSVYSASGTLLYRDNATTGAATDYIRMGGRAIARVRGSDVEWTYADHLGSPAAAASAAGAILWREDHTPYGEARQAPAANADNEGFTGHIADAASGLVYMQARYYDPVVGRFLSSDPVGFAQGGVSFFNRYAYTANDPVNATDPTGTVCRTQNVNSGHCRRSQQYADLHSRHRGRTHFFGAASMTTEALATAELRLIGMGSGLSQTTKNFLNNTGAALSVHINGAARSGSYDLGGSISANDRAFVRTEQALVQEMLDALGPDEYNQIVSEINVIINPNFIQNAGAGIFDIDSGYRGILDQVRSNLSRDIDFSKLDDRIAIGDAIMAAIRDDSAVVCSRGSRIRREEC